MSVFDRDQVAEHHSGFGVVAQGPYTDLFEALAAARIFSRYSAGFCADVRAKENRRRRGAQTKSRQSA